ncbi:MAG: hypothetical protein V4495_28925 [Pseudomonadota bacterium]
MRPANFPFTQTSLINDKMSLEQHSAVLTLTPGFWGCEIKMQNLQNKIYSVYLRYADGSIGEQTLTNIDFIAVVAFKHLISRADLRAQQPMAVFEENGRELDSVKIDGFAGQSSISLPFNQYSLPDRLAAHEYSWQLTQQAYPKDFSDTPIAVFNLVKHRLNLTDDDILRATTSTGWKLSKNRLNNWQRKNSNGYYLTPMRYEEVGAILRSLEFYEQGKWENVIR